MDLFHPIRSRTGMSEKISFNYEGYDSIARTCSLILAFQRFSRRLEGFHDSEELCQYGFRTKISLQQLLVPIEALCLPTWGRN